MRLSVFTTITDPFSRGDNFADSLRCYMDLADEVVIVNGGVASAFDDGFTQKIKTVDYEWPKEFSWEFIGQQFQRGYEACTGDWVIHADLDFVFHESDFARIRQAMEGNPNAPALSFWKYQFILPDRYNLKSRLVLAVNKKAYGDRIKFDSGGDLCQPSLDGAELKPDNVPEAKIPFYNYDKLLKTKDQIRNDVGRMARAWGRHFGDNRLGTDDESAYQEWLGMMLGRFGKPQQEISLDRHPKYVQETIRNLQPESWGYNGHGHLQNNNYTEGA